MIGVLVMAHGTPAGPDEIEAFYTRIRRGRPPTPEQLSDLVSRYEAIGGTSPLTARTYSQVAELAALLERDAPGTYRVRFGAKHVHPSIEYAANELAEDGTAPVVGLVLTPHQSAVGSDEYHARARSAFGDAVTYRPADPWYASPGFVALQSTRVSAAIAALHPPLGQRVHVAFTAHSVPERTVADGDPYPTQVAASASLIAAAADVEDFSVAWQSAGRTPEPWIGPALADTLRELGASGAWGVVVCPVGFVADHLEVLYDLDIEARAVAESAGVRFARTTSLNSDPGFIRVLADSVKGAA